MAGDYNRAFQQTVETCALVICLWVCKEEIWDTYTKEEKDVIAEFLEVMQMEIQFRRTGVCLTCSIWLFLTWKATRLTKKSCLIMHRVFLPTMQAMATGTEMVIRLTTIPDLGHLMFMHQYGICGMAMRSSRISQQSLRSTQ